MTSLTERNGAAEAVAPRGTRREMRPIDSAHLFVTRDSRERIDIDRRAGQKSARVPTVTGGCSCARCGTDGRKATRHVSQGPLRTGACAYHPIARLETARTVMLR